MLCCVLNTTPPCSSQTSEKRLKLTLLTLTGTLPLTLAAIVTFWGLLFPRLVWTVLSSWCWALLLWFVLWHCGGEGLGQPLSLSFHTVTLPSRYARETGNAAVYSPPFHLSQLWSAFPNMFISLFHLAQMGHVGYTAPVCGKTVLKPIKCISGRPPPNHAAARLPTSSPGVEAAGRRPLSIPCRVYTCTLPQLCHTFSSGRFGKSLGTPKYNKQHNKTPHPIWSPVVPTHEQTTDLNLCCVVY